MKSAPSLEAFFSAPLDACVTTPWGLVWCSGSGRCGVSVFGVFDRKRVTAFFETLARLDLHPALGPHVSIVDFRGVTYTDLPAMDFFVATLRRHLPRFAKRVTRRLLILPTGALAIAFGGIYFQVPRLYPVRFGTDLVRNLRWLQVPRRDPLVAWLERRRAERSGRDVVLQRAVDALDEGATTVAACAKAAGLSTRSFQRALEQRGTRFSALRQQVRLDRARVLLGNSTHSIAEVADACGFASQQHLTTAFRVAFGDTPAAFRRAAGANL